MGRRAALHETAPAECVDATTPTRSDAAAGCGGAGSGGSLLTCWGASTHNWNMDYCIYLGYCTYLDYCNYLDYLSADWLATVGSRMLYKPDPRKHSGKHRNYQCQWVVQVDSIIRKLLLVPVGDTGTITYGMAASFPGADGDSRPDAGDGCQLSRWYVNSWALGWSRDI